MRLEILYEDYLVARRRYSWARRRNLYCPSPKTHPNKLKVASKAPDVRRHGDLLREALLAVMAFPSPHLRICDREGLVSLSAAETQLLKLGRRVADARLRADQARSACGCGLPECGKVLVERGGGR